MSCGRETCRWAGCLSLAQRISGTAPHRLPDGLMQQGVCCCTTPFNQLKMEMNMKKFTMTLAILMSALALSACNTIDGAGKDIERAGEKVQDASGKNR